MGFNVYIRGKPQRITIDDIIPFVTVNGKVIPAFA